MKAIHALSGMLIALLLGAVAGYLIGADAGDPPAPPPDHPGPVAAIPQLQEPKAPTTEPAPQAPGGLAPWLATLADEKPRPGTGRIHGRVATADGRGIAGITVSAAAQYPHKWRNTPEVPLEEIVEDTARRTHFQRAGISKTQTDSEGRYEFANLGDYEYVMSAAGPGYNCDAKSTYRPVRPGVEVNFTAKPVGEVEVDVLMPDGSPAIGANISLDSKRGGRGYTWKPDERVFPLEPGKTTVSATMGKHREMITEAHEVEYNEGNPPLKLVLQLKVVPGILCVVTLPEGFPRYWDLQVGLIPDPPAKQPLPGRYVGFRDDEILRDDDSEVAFTRLEPGAYRVVLAWGNRALVWADVRVGNEFLTVPLTLPKPEAKDYIVVRVLAPDGKPAPDASIYASLSADSGNGTDMIILHQPDDSAWVFRVGMQDDEKPLMYTIRAHSGEFGRVEAEYPSDATHELELRFQAPAFLTVTVPGATTHPMKKRLRPTLWRAEGDGLSHQFGAFGDDPLESDKLTTAALTPGRYRFELELNSGNDDDEVGHGRRTLAAWNFELTPGQNVHICPIPTLCKLTLNVPDSATVKGLSLTCKDQTGAKHTPSAGTTPSRMLFEALPAGEWKVQTGEGEMTFTLAGDTELTLNLRKYDCLTLSISSKGKITGMGLRNGDKLLRVGSEEVRNLQDGFLPLVASLRKDSITWTVIRAGREVEVTFNGRALDELLKGSDDDETLDIDAGFRD